jgi:hypothetical protein
MFVVLCLLRIVAAVVVYVVVAVVDYIVVTDISVVVSGIFFGVEHFELSFSVL